MGLIKEFVTNNENIHIEVWVENPNNEKLNVNIRLSIYLKNGLLYLSE